MLIPLLGTKNLGLPKKGKLCFWFLLVVPLSRVLVRCAMSRYGIPSVSDLLPLFFDECACISFLFRYGIFYNERECPTCGRPMVFYVSQMSFMCNKWNCRVKIGMKTNSFFFNSHLPCSKIMHLGYLWLTKTSPGAARIHAGISKQAIADFYSHFRDLVASDPVLEDVEIGGPGVIVELDECKLGKRKYNRGHHVEGVWIFGGIERTADKRTFFVAVKDRSAETLLSLISEHVAEGSIIHTDMWRSYSGIEELLQMPHFTVNHSSTFVNPIDGTHTNTIEGVWNGLKIVICPRNRQAGGIEKHIAEYQWKRIHKTDRWVAFLNLLRDTHFG